VFHLALLDALDDAIGLTTAIKNIRHAITNGHQAAGPAAKTAVGQRGLGHGANQKQ
jgi:hypothetical protein